MKVTIDADREVTIVVTEAEAQQIKRLCGNSTRYIRESLKNDYDPLPGPSETCTGDMAWPYRLYDSLDEAFKR